MSDELLIAESTDVLELDELWSFVKARRHKVWTWIALCRRTRQVVAYVCGQRDDEACTDLRCSIPMAYFNLETCSDYWAFKYCWQAYGTTAFGREYDGNDCAF